MTNKSIGKFGEAEILLTGLDIFNESKIEEKFLNTSKIEIPIVKSSVYQIISIDTDKSVTLLDIRGNTKADLKLPMVTEGDIIMTKKISENFSSGKEILITAIYSLGQEKIIDFKIL